jgi:signal transduction histidine kinase
VLEGALISGLLYERRRRLHAEVQSRQRSTELAHIYRFSMTGELTATIAHEINQPLGAILTNIEPAELMVKFPAPIYKRSGKFSLTCTGTTSAPAKSLADCGAC